MQEVSAKRALEQFDNLKCDLASDAERADEPEDEEARQCREAVEAADKAEKKAKTEAGILSGDTVANMSILPTFTMAALIGSYPRFAQDGLFLRIDLTAKTLYMEDVEGSQGSVDFSNDYVI